MYKKGPRNFHADALPRLHPLVGKPLAGWDEIPSFLLNKQLSELTIINQADHPTVLRTLCFKLPAMIPNCNGNKTSLAASKSWLTGT